MKKLLGIVFLGLLLSGNVNAGWFDKLPVLACEIDGQYITYDLRKYTPLSKANPNTKLLIFDPKDDEYMFYKYIKESDGTMRNLRHTVNRYSGIINLSVSPKYVQGQTGGLAKSLKTEVSFNGICKGVK